MIVNYEVLVYKTSLELSLGVKNRIKEGWQPLGGVGEISSNERSHFYQAMVRQEEDSGIPPLKHNTDNVGIIGPLDLLESSKVVLNDYMDGNISAYAAMMLLVEAIKKATGATNGIE